jgi:hypothetical protein
MALRNSPKNLFYPLLKFSGPRRAGDAIVVVKWNVKMALNCSQKGPLSQEATMLSSQA